MIEMFFVTLMFKSVNSPQKYAQRFEKFDVLRNCHQKIAFRLNFYFKNLSMKHISLNESSGTTEWDILSISRYFLVSP